MVVNKQVKQRIIAYLRQIDGVLDKIEKIDPWGDLVENFEDIDRIRVTKRIIKDIGKGELK